MIPANLTVRILVCNDTAVLDRVAPGVFDNAVDPRWAAEFLADLRHHLAVALDGDLVVGMARGCITSTRTSRPNCGLIRLR
jgi:hypothetical protein